jgi:hypothetical protein
MDFSRLPRRMRSCWVPNKRLVGRPRFTYGETIRKALQKFGLTNTALLDITWHDLAKKRCISSSIICPNNFYNGISHSDATTTLARANKPTPLRTNPNKILVRHKPWGPAEYFTVPCMDLGHRSLVVAKAWVRGKSSSHPKVNLIMSGDSGFRTFVNSQAQTWFSDAIEASLLGNFHPALLPTKIF